MISILEKSNQRMQAIDLESKLLESGIIFITEVLDSDTVTSYQAQLLYLMSILKPEDTKSNPIQIYINSPGGEVDSTFGLYDIMQMMINKGYIIKTVNVGLAASGASVILMAGSPGYRCTLPNCTVMVHQPHTKTAGTTAEIVNEGKEMQRIKDIMAEIARKHACKEVVPMLEKDSYMSVEDAIKYKVVDKIIGQ